VYARATRMACMCLVPDTVMRAMSTQPLSSHTSSMARTSSSLVSEKLTPRRMRSLT